MYKHDIIQIHGHIPKNELIMFGYETAYRWKYEKIRIRLEKRKHEGRRIIK